MAPMGSAPSPSAHARAEVRPDHARIATTEYGFCQVTARGQLRCRHLFVSAENPGEDPPDGTYVAVVSYGRGYCALARTGEVRCWSSVEGRFLLGLRFAGQYVELASDGAAVCARRASGVVDCARSWSRADAFERQPGKVDATPLAGTFDKLWSGAGLCASRARRTTCFSPAAWYGPEDQRTPFGPAGVELEGDFVSVARGRWTACGVTRIGELRCKRTGWPSDPSVRRFPASPAGDGEAASIGGTGFVRVVGDWRLCGQRVDGSLACEPGVGGADTDVDTFGVASVQHRSQFDVKGARAGSASDVYRVVGSSPSIAFAGMTAEVRGGFVEITSARAICGRRADDTVTCIAPAFYDDDVVNAAKEVRAEKGSMLVDGRTVGYVGTFTGAADADASYGGRELGVDPYSASDDNRVRARAPRGHRLRDLQFGNDVACGIAADQTVRCYGEIMGSRAKARPPSDKVTALSLGGVSACAITAKDGSVRCWGDNYFHQQSAAPRGADFVGLSASYLNHCAQKRSGELVCWGRSFDGMFELPFVPSSYALTQQGVCAVSRERPGLRCWGFGYAWFAPES